VCYLQVQSLREAFQTILQQYKAKMEQAYDVRERGVSYIFNKLSMVCKNYIIKYWLDQ